MTAQHAATSMKHDNLRSIAHNIADSLASGCSLLIGIYEIDVFGEAYHSTDGVIEVDFLSGTVTAGNPSPHLAKAVGLFRDCLPEFCTKHGADIAQLRALKARYSIATNDAHVLVIVEDQFGRRSEDEYVGVPLRRPKIVESDGRIRTKR